MILIRGHWFGSWSSLCWLFLRNNSVGVEGGGVSVVSVRSSHPLSWNVVVVVVVAIHGSNLCYDSRKPRTIMHRLTTALLLLLLLHHRPQSTTTGEMFELDSFDSSNNNSYHHKGMMIHHDYPLLDKSPTLPQYPHQPAQQQRQRRRPTGPTIRGGSLNVDH